MKEGLADEMWEEKVTHTHKATHLCVVGMTKRQSLGLPMHADVCACGYACACES